MLRNGPENGVAVDLPVPVFAAIDPNIPPPIPPLFGFNFVGPMMVFDEILRTSTGDYPGDAQLYHDHRLRRRSVLLRDRPRGKRHLCPRSDSNNPHDNIRRFNAPMGLEAAFAPLILWASRRTGNKPYFSGCAFFGSTRRMASTGFPTLTEWRTWRPSGGAGLKVYH